MVFFEVYRSLKLAGLHALARQAEVDRIEQSLKARNRRRRASLKDALGRLRRGSTRSLLPVDSADSLAAEPKRDLSVIDPQVGTGGECVADGRVSLVALAVAQTTESASESQLECRSGVEKSEALWPTPRPGASHPTTSSTGTISVSKRRGSVLGALRNAQRLFRPAQVRSESVQAAEL